MCHANAGPRGEIGSVKRQHELGRARLSTIAVVSMGRTGQASLSKFRIRQFE